MLSFIYCSVLFTKPVSVSSIVITGGGYSSPRTILEEPIDTLVYWSVAFGNKLDSDSFTECSVVSNDTIFEIVGISTKGIVLFELVSVVKLGIVWISSE